MQHFATKKNIFTHTLLLILFCTNLRIFLLCQHIHKKNNTNVRIIFYYEHVSYKFIIVVVISSLILLSSINILQVLSLSSNSKLENSALAGLARVYMLVYAGTMLWNARMPWKSQKTLKTCILIHKWTSKKIYYAIREKYSICVDILLELQERQTHSRRSRPPKAKINSTHIEYI